MTRSAQYAKPPTILGDTHSWTVICRRAFGHSEMMTMTRCFQSMVMRPRTQNSGCMACVIRFAKTSLSRFWQRFGRFCGRGGKLSMKQFSRALKQPMASSRGTCRTWRSFKIQARIRAQMSQCHDQFIRNQKHLLRDTIKSMLMRVFE